MGGGPPRAFGWLLEFGLGLFWKFCSALGIAFLLERESVIMYDLTIHAPGGSLNLGPEPEDLYTPVSFLNVHDGIKCSVPKPTM